MTQVLGVARHMVDDDFSGKGSTSALEEGNVHIVSQQVEKFAGENLVTSMNVAESGAKQCDLHSNLNGWVAMRKEYGMVFIVG